MDSKGFVFLTFIAGFNRIKHLTTDMELIKFVCYHSRAIDFRVGVDGKDRLRPREGWEKWVLGISERDPSAQNDGPDELHHPPIPHPNGFEHAGPHYVGVPAGSPTGPVPHPLAKGVHPAGPQDPSMVVPESMPNGQAINGVNGVAGSNGHLETHKDVSGESDSFLNEQVEALSVIVRKQEQPQVPTLPPSATRTFSNGSIDSRSDLPDESDEINGWQKINGTIPAQG
jgi:la-related protein 1